MDHIVSATLIPANGINVKLDHKLFIGNFIDKAEEALDSLPVGSAIEIIFDHITTLSDGTFKNIKHCRCLVKQSKRGEFSKSIESAPVEESIRPCLYKYKQKRRYLRGKLALC